MFILFLVVCLVSPFMWRLPVMHFLEPAKGPWSQPRIQTGSFPYRRLSWWFLAGKCRNCLPTSRCWQTLWKYGQRSHALNLHSHFTVIKTWTSHTGTGWGRAARLPGSLHRQRDGEPLWPVWPRLLPQGSRSRQRILQPAEWRQSAYSARFGPLPHRLRSVVEGDSAVVAFKIHYYAKLLPQCFLTVSCLKPPKTTKVDFFSYVLVHFPVGSD